MGNASDEAGARGYLMITFSRAAGGIAGELQLRDHGYLSGKKRPDPAAAFAETLGQAGITDLDDLQPFRPGLVQPLPSEGGLKTCHQAEESGKLLMNRQGNNA